MNKLDLKRNLNYKKSENEKKTIGLFVKPKKNSLPEESFYKQFLIEAFFIVKWTFK